MKHVCSILVMTLACTVGISGCSSKWTPPRDNDGNTPAEVVASFIQLVNAKDYEKAKSLWILEDDLYPEASDFAAFCKKIESLDESDIDFTNRGKSGWCQVYFKGQPFKNKGSTQQYFSLKQINGKWMISRRFYW